MYEDDYISQEEEFQAGWEAVQSLLASDEEWARFLYESFHGQDA